MSAAVSAPDVLKTQVEALTFDVFGTVVDWRASVTSELATLAAKKVASAGSPPKERPIATASATTSSSSPPPTSSSPASNRARAQALEVLFRLTPEDWSTFAQQWRDTYKVFTSTFVRGETPWKDIDAHHLDSLRQLLGDWGIRAAYTDDETLELSRMWHRLRPWQDSAEGIRLLGSKYETSTLSNGNTSLLRDLDDFGGLGFRNILSAEDFRAYKPNPAVYLGAARKLGVEGPGKVAMVAAHLGDLRAARGCGLRTIYVERPREEDWGVHEERYREAKEWVDLWVKEDEGGFVEVARRLGLS